VKVFKSLNTDNRVVVSPYLLNINCITYRVCITKLRAEAHNFRIETGRHTDVLDQKDRTCQICDSSDIEDVAHFFLHCPVYKLTRTQLFTSPVIDLDKIRLILDKPSNSSAKFLYGMYQLRSSLLSS
jgi:hypothetical protein